MNQFIAVVFPDEKKAYEGWRAEQKLRAAADAAGERMKRYSEETEAKKASADAKSRIDARIAEIRADQKQRLGKLEQARKLAQEALRP